jgi:hypothetical protein
VLRSFPNVEELVLVSGEIMDEILKRSDLEFVRPKDIPRSPALMKISMETFQPWRAVAHLYGIAMMEHAVERYVESVYKRIAASREESGTGVDLFDEWTVPKFKIRQIRSARKAMG